MGVVVLMGSVYMILATNIGSRLSFLVTLTGLMGWMVLMGHDVVDLRHRSQGA